MNWKKRTLTPSVRRLAFKFAAKKAVPDGGGLMDGVRWIKSGEMQDDLNESFRLTFEAIDAIKAAKDNTYGTDDESIAAAILAEIDKRGQKGDER